MNKQSLPIEWIERIFSRLHGRFGNQFTDKFKMGVYDNSGNDIGLLNAKQVWADELAGISAERIKTALSHKYEYPPSCDEFRLQCKTPATIHPPFNALPHKFTQKEKEANKVRLQDTLRQLKIKRI